MNLEAFISVSSVSTGWCREIFRFQSLPACAYFHSSLNMRCFKVIMGNLFGKRHQSPPAISQQDQAILQLKTQRDKIKQYVRRNEKQMDHEREMAKQLIRDGRKDRALLLLKKKRYQETIIERTLKQLDQIDRMVHDLEFAEIERRVVEGLKSGNEALKQMSQMFSIEEVEKIMEETQEAADYQEEISKLLSGNLSETDLEEVESELQALIDSEEPLKLPEVPTESLPQPVSGGKERERERTAKQRVAVEAL
uniref:Charged multivesicular body protein 6 n=1 Tax=Parascaris univalens TaxID=6257 RepID=A0A915BR79_PARUN